MLRQDRKMEKKDEKTISKALPPEDIRPGDYVSVTHVLGEFLPCFSEMPWQPVELIRVMMLPWQVQPMKVVEVCLPFVLVRKVSGKHETLDVRRYRLARVSKDFGRKAFKRLQIDS